jgi:hypothetical protein
MKHAINVIIDSERAAEGITYGLLSTTATRVGLDIRPMPGGMLEILDMSGNRVSYAKSIPEAMDFLKTVGVPENALHIPDLDVDHPLPPSLRNLAPMMPEFVNELNPTTAQVYGENSLRTKWINAFNRMDLAQETFSTVEAKAVAFDETFGTGFRHLVTEIKNSSIKMHNTILRLENDPLMLEIKAQLKLIKNQAEREHVTGALNAATIDGLMKPDGLILDGDLRPEVRQIAERFVKLNIDPRRVLQYRTQLHHAENAASNSILAEAIEQVHTERSKMQAAMHRGDANITPEVIAAKEQELMQNALRKAANYKNTAVYQNAIKRIEMAFPDRVNSEFNEARTILEDLFRVEDTHIRPDGFDKNGQPKFRGVVSTGGLQVLGVVEIWSRLTNPETNFNMTDYMNHHKFTPAQRKAAELLKKYYDREFTSRALQDPTTFNPDGTIKHMGVARIMQYAPRLRTVGLEVNDKTFNDFAGTAQAEATRDFVSMMNRIGELDNYVHDPLQAVQLWNRAYSKYLHLYPQIPVVRQAFKNAEKLMINDPASYKYATNEIQNFFDRNLGKPDVNTIALRNTYVKHLRDSGFSDSEIIDRIQGANMTDVLMTYMNANVLGARPDQAVRDLYDGWRKAYIFFGGKRAGVFAKNFIGVSTKLDKALEARFKALKQSGVIRPADYLSIYNPVANTDAKFTTGDLRARAGNLATDYADVAFRTSFQGPVYERIQAAAYLEAYDNAMPAVGEFIKGAITTKQLRERVQLARYDIPQQERFLSLANSGMHKEAVAYLAQETSHVISGSFITGNIGPRNGIYAKMFGQLQTWNIANRSPMVKMMARGEDATDVFRINRRIATAEALNLTFGKLTGMNTFRYANVPVLSFFVTGTPFANALSTASQSIGAMTVGGAAAQQRAEADLKNLINLATPFGYAGQTVADAYSEFFDRGHEGHGIARTVLGIRPSKRDIQSEWWLAKPF